MPLNAFSQNVILSAGRKGSILLGCFPRGAKVSRTVFFFSSHNVSFFGVKDGTSEGAIV